MFVGGNIGNPLIEYVAGSQEEDFVVAEISSFQLQWIEKFRPFVSIILNVTCDHINYHGSFDEYRRIKARIFANQTNLILPFSMPKTRPRRNRWRQVCASVPCLALKE